MSAVYVVVYHLVVFCYGSLGRLGQAAVGHLCCGRVELRSEATSVSPELFPHFLLLPPLLFMGVCRKVWTFLLPFSFQLLHWCPLLVRGCWVEGACGPGPLLRG